MTLYDPIPVRNNLLAVFGDCYVIEEDDIVHDKIEYTTDDVNVLWKEYMDMCIHAL